VSGNDSFTKVLLHFDGSDGSTTITDVNAGGSAHAWTAAGNAQIDTAESKFGGASLLCDGGGDYVSTPDHSDFTLGSGDFTVDCWFNCTAAGGSFEVIAGKTKTGSAGVAADRSWILLRNTSNVITGQVFVGSSAFTVNGTTQFTDALNTGWHHAAFVRDGDTLKFFIDGVQEGGDVAVSGAVNDLDGPLAVGRMGDETFNTWTGSLDEFRLSVGVARWTANFTPPDLAYSVLAPVSVNAGVNATSAASVSVGKAVSAAVSAVADLALARILVQTITAGVAAAVDTTLTRIISVAIQIGVNASTTFRRAIAKTISLVVRVAASGNAGNAAAVSLQPVSAPVSATLNAVPTPGAATLNPVATPTSGTLHPKIESQDF